jgi:short-subunit dehydrogenase involved in D-alanine esterification of teichoic acids
MEERAEEYITNISNVIAKLRSREDDEQMFATIKKQYPAVDIFAAMKCLEEMK